MTIPSTPATLSYLRDNARELLNEFDAADALACYYTLHHDPKRTALFMHRDSAGKLDGYLARCQTGFDLFRPLVTFRLRGGETALPDLLGEALAPGRPYLAVIPASYAERVKPYLSLSDPSLNLILRLDPSHYQPEMNVLVTRRTDPDGSPRTEIKHGKKMTAWAGVNWRSPLFAEMTVTVAGDERGRGYGYAVASALVAELLHMQVIPVYAVDEHNEASLALAEKLGFADTGAREIMAQAVRTI